MGLTTTAKLETHLGIPTGSDPTLLNQVIAEVEAGVLLYTGRMRLESGTETRYYDGHGHRDLYTGFRPVTAVTTVHLDADGFGGDGTDDPFGSTTLQTVGEDYRLVNKEEDDTNRGVLRRIGNDFRGSPKVWTEGDGNIKVVMTVGYTTIPLDLELAVHHLCTAVRRAALKQIGGALGSETLGKYSYRLLSAASGQNGQTPQDIMGAAGLLEKHMMVAI